MAARTHRIDPRAARVRTLLREAAFALAHERPVDELTVGDIVARAHVSRQVFYRHFTDRDDAVATAVTVAFAAATADINYDPRSRILRPRGPTRPARPPAIRTSSEAPFGDGAISEQAVHTTTVIRA